ncbi:hypothetical protein FA13DRAFT_1235000 [Coprinellus micaceus]|uniref:Uncharacterized protein n=1 Tax=Coprinellus micaceus TaxID=71717 RepID=A0A4Y7TPS9_COPMI|nr:hypothetical protein FA13DRAFT_1235000 [Coprinellus micaceus]
MRSDDPSAFKFPCIVVWNAGTLTRHLHMAGGFFCSPCTHYASDHCLQQRMAGVPTSSSCDSTKIGFPSYDLLFYARILLRPRTPPSGAISASLFQ